jgi:glycerophosphoryl diester phosphodiesterase
MRPRAILSTFIALLIAALAAPAAAAVPMPVEVLIAHRGLAGGAEVKYMLPEESIPAWQWAIDKHGGFPGAQIVDMDTQITSDGKLAVMHDATINRTTNRSGSVANVTLDYIKGAWLELPVDLNGNGDPDNTPYHPPSLNQALDFLKPKVNTVDGKPVLISLEIKGAGWSQAMLNRLFVVINGKGMKDRVIVHSARPVEVTYAKTAGFPKLGYVTGNTSSLPSVETIQAYVGNQPGQYVFLRLESALANPGVINDYNDAKLNVCLSILSNRSDYENAVALGDVYAWVTDDVIDAREFLEQNT